MSTYSAEDSQFLTGVPEMKQFMSEQAVEKSREITNSERTTQRQKMGKLEGPYSSLVNNKLAS